MSDPSTPTLVRPFLKRKTLGAAPGVFAIDPDAPQPKLEFFGCGADHCHHEMVDSVSALQDRIGNHPLCWVNIDGLGNETVIRALGDLFQIHPLALEDVVHVHQRAKVEEYPGHLFIVLRMVWLDDVLQTEQLSLVVRPGMVVTFQETPGDSLDPVRRRLEDARSALRTASAGQLTAAILDAVVDGYYPVIEEFGNWIEAVEDRIDAGASASCVDDIHDLRRELLFLRRCLWPLRETMNLLLRDQSQFFSPETRLQLRDTYDHTVQLMDVVETYREMCSDLRDYYYAVVSQRTNDVMRVLTIVATIFMPLSFIASVYGMNFETESPYNMPELGWRLGYPFALGLMASVAGGMLIYFYRKGWLSDRRDDRRRGAGPEQEEQAG
ncbi:MAG: magnesium/cobalt transporter CorA [Planctomyces sp.]|nr:magnesium/cobalt transporter CorA [Planctomyces sp.]